MIVVSDAKAYRPVSTQYMILGILKNLYPKQVAQKLNTLEALKKDLFCKANGNDEILSLLRNEQYVAWKLILYDKKEREEFRQDRLKYLLYQ